LKEALDIVIMIISN